jgi:hypothetical protein
MEQAQGPFQLHREKFAPDQIKFAKPPSRRVHACPSCPPLTVDADLDLVRSTHHHGRAPRGPGCAAKASRREAAAAGGEEGHRG